MGEERFRAPWGRTLTATTALCLLILLGITIWGLSLGPQDLLVWRLGMIALPLSVLIMAPFFSIRRVYDQCGIDSRLAPRLEDGREARRLGLRQA